MSQLRQRKAKIIGPGAPKELPVEGENDNKKRLLKKKRPIGLTGSGGQQSNLKRYLGLLFALSVGYLGYFMLPKLADQPLPTRYGVCGFEDSIYTTARRRTQCIVINDDAVEFEGTLLDTRTRFGDLDTLGSLARLAGSQQPGASSGLKIYRLKPGQVVLPGLTDAHGHLLEYGHSLSQASLTGATSIEDVVNRLVKHINSLPLEQRNDYSRVIEGRGFDQTKWPGQAFPTHEDLDVPSLKDRKLFLHRVDLHACWVSASLLDTIDVPAEFPGGAIMRFPDGRPTGVFLDTAYEWVYAQLPQWTDRNRLEYLHAGAEDLLKNGITGVHDAATTLPNIKFLKTLDEQRLLPLRIYSMAACPKLDEYCGDQVDRYEGERLVVRSVKLFLDGALGSWGAAMLEPYTDSPSQRGILRMSAEKLAELAHAWIVRKGFQVNTHAIGDAANHLVIEAYADILRTTGKSNIELRLRNEHAQVLRSEDITSAGALGLIASVQPTHCTSDMDYAELRLGPDRIKGAYAWQSLSRAGCPLSLGSDFPVENVNPFEGIYSAISRLNITGSSPHGPRGWYPEEALSREQAFEGFTSGAAWARFAENQLGSLQKGFKADFVVVDRDVMKVPISEVRRTQVVATVLDGRLVYGEFRP